MDEKHHEVLVKASKDFMQHRSKGYNNKQCTVHAIVYADGTVHHPHTHCFAGARCVGRRSIGLLLSISDTFGGEYLEGEFTPAENVRYLDWLMNRSPWESAFIGKDAPKSYQNRFVLLRTDIPANMLFGAGVAVRKMWETTSVKRVWLDMTAVGVQEDFAYYLGACAQLSGSDVGWGANERGHGNLETPFNYGTLVNYLTHKPTKLTSLYTTGEEVGGYSAMWNGRGKGVNEFMKANLFAGKQAEQAVVNPFAKATQSNLKLMPYKQAVEAMAEFQHVLFKEVGFNYEPKDIVYPKPLTVEAPKPPVVKVAFKRDRYGRFCA